MSDTPDKFAIGIHALVEEMQTTHGLRHDDYKGYHGYCTRRLSRLRHHQAVKKDLVSSGAYVSGEKKRRNAFCKRELPETIAHADVLLSVIVNAERAWAHSNELKALIHAPPTDRTHEKSKSAPGKIRQHYLSKLRRAKQLATQLEVLCIQFADAQTQQEAKAYASWMKGNVGLEKGEWKVRYCACDTCIERGVWLNGLSSNSCLLLQSACQDFATSISLCRTLSAQNADNLELRDLFESRATNVLKPLWRYCQYEYKESGADDVPELLDEPTSSATSDKTGAVSFRGQEIGVENKSLKVLLLKLEGLLIDFKPSDEDDSKLTALLSIHDDCTVLIEGDLQRVQQMKAGPAVNAKRQELEYLMSYVKHGKLQLLMKRLEIMISKTTKPGELAHLYDALLQDAKAVCALPPQVEDEFWLEANANVLRVRAFRCHQVGLLYASLNKLPEAFALLEQAKVLADRASEEIGACEGMDEAYLEALDNLQVEIKGAVLRIRTQVYLGGSSALNKSSLLSSLDFFSAQATLAELTLIPIPCKPTFFDIAWNHACQFPMGDIQKHIDENKPKSSGVMGWFRS